MRYNETINWPVSLDLDFPNLRDNTSAAIAENERVYAAHYNKAANLARKAYFYLLGSDTATGDGSLQELSMPRSVTVSLATLAAVGAFDLEQDPRTLVPGNVLPFEFVVTDAGANYNALRRRGGAALLLQGPPSAVLDAFGGVDPVGRRTLCSARIVSPDDRVFDPTLPSPTELSAVCHALLGPDTLVVRGAVVDGRISSIRAETGTGPAQWLASGSLSPVLRISLIAVGD